MSFNIPKDVREPMWTLGFKNGVFECLDGGTALCTSLAAVLFVSGVFWTPCVRLHPAPDPPALAIHITYLMEQCYVLVWICANLLCWVCSALLAPQDLCPVQRF